MRRLIKVGRNVSLNDSQSCCKHTLSPPGTLHLPDAWVGSDVQFPTTRLDHYGGQHPAAGVLGNAGQVLRDVALEHAKTRGRM